MSLGYSVIKENRKVCVKIKKSSSSSSGSSRNLGVKIDNKSILIGGMVFLGCVGALCAYEEALLASISGLVAYLANNI